MVCKAVERRAQFIKVDVLWPVYSGRHGPKEGPQKVISGFIRERIIVGKAYKSRAAIMASFTNIRCLKVLGDVVESALDIGALVCS